MPSSRDSSPHIPPQQITAQTCHISLSTVITPRFAQAPKTLIVDSWLTEDAGGIKIRKWPSEDQYEVCLFWGESVSE